MTNDIKIVIYVTQTGKAPFTEWIEELDSGDRAIIRSRLARIRTGNLGDCKPIKAGNGVWEFRIAHGPGYRVYFGKKGTTIIVLLIGGDKGSQVRDIAKAKQYWALYKE